MSLTGYPLPDFLSDLKFSIGGQTLRGFEVPHEPDVFRIDFRSDGYQSVGLFVNFEAEYAKIKTSQSTTIFQSGEVRTHTRWDGLPKPEQVGDFKAWIRAQVIKDIDRLLSWHMEGVVGKDALAEGTAHLEQLCADFAALPDFKMTHIYENSIYYRFLGAIHRLRTKQSTLDNEEPILREFVDNHVLKPIPLGDTYMEMCVSVALHICPEPAGVLAPLIEKMLDSLFSPHEALGEPTLHSVTQVSRLLSKMPEVIRLQAQPRLLALCISPPLSHAAAYELRGQQSEAAVYIEHGLAQSPESVSLLVYAESFYNKQGDTKRLSELRIQISNIGIVSSNSNDVQDWINRYTHLCNDFQYFDPTTNPKETVPELLKLESKLNQYWLDQLKQVSSLLRSSFQDELIAQSRFLSAGSASIVGWLRNQHRYQEVVDYMMPLQDNLELCLLRSKTNRRGFEAFLSNGLACFLDSKKEDHIAQAIQLVDALEATLSPWDQSGLLYNLGCIAARAGQTQRALTYARQAIEKGSDIEAMAKDTDFRSLWDHPDFKELLQVQV